MSKGLIMKKYYAGVDIGGTSIKIGLFTDGTMGEDPFAAQKSVPTRTANKGEAILGDIIEAIESLMNEKGDGVLAGVGLAVPGAVMQDRLAAPCVNLDGWGGFDAAEKFLSLAKGSKYITANTCVKVLNDANAAALGEDWKGGGEGCRSSVFVTLGTGVGGGIVLDGKLLIGAHGSGGEIGHMKLDPYEEGICGCGGHGCSEYYASATGIVRTAVKIVAESTEEEKKASKLAALPEITSKDVMTLAQEGDALAIKAAETFGKWLGTLLANLSCTVDPEVYVIGGGVSYAGQYIIDLVQPNFEEKAFPPTKGCNIRLATLGSDAGMYGAARFVM